MIIRTVNGEVVYEPIDREAIRARYERNLTIDERPVTWDEIAALEPQLAYLLEMAQRSDVNDREVYPRWYSHYKPLVVGLVGRARDPHHTILSSRHSYDCAYRTILHALEDAARPDSHV